MSDIQVNETAIPRPEYPRPDWQRTDWLSLNGKWSFSFDLEDKGRTGKWFREGSHSFTDLITVPFSWASPLSGIGSNDKGIAWYSRKVEWRPKQPGSRVFIKFGAVDYSCDVWVNQVRVGSHTGGYGAFELDVTHAWRDIGENHIVVRVEDPDENIQTRGKQGYGELRGIWQPVWLEACPQNYIQSGRWLTHLDGTVDFTGKIQAIQSGTAQLWFSFDGGRVTHAAETLLETGENTIHTSFKIASPQLWSPENPYLYEGTIELSTQGQEADQIQTYIGIREIGTALYGERNYRWITLNGKPIFLSGTLDQSFHPEGYFTYPTDDDMYNEIWRLKRLGLNFVRIHIKPEEPRKLYWADKLGMLVMEDMPCFWGEPSEQARSTYELEAQEIIERDFNHPSIISWVMFNETWGLFTKNEEGKRGYLPETQEWVREIYLWAKKEDPSRLIEDNSPCNLDHVESDLNTWHFYKNGYENVRNHLQEVVDETFPESSFNYIGGNIQSDAPLMNSECGAVWGIQGSAGDSDIAWHYRYMINEFRRHDKMTGFIFTEFHDVINEFNGYYRINGNDKDFGYDWFNPGMSLSDLHSPDFVVIDAPPCQTVSAGDKIFVPLLRSSYSELYHRQTLQLTWELWYDRLGQKIVADQGTIAAEWNGYGVAPLSGLSLTMPSCDALAVLAVTLKTAKGRAVTRNFITFDVQSGTAGGQYELEGNWFSFAPAQYSQRQWEYAWNALADHKVNGGPHGFVEYQVQLPESFRSQPTGSMELLFEAGAKIVLGKDKEMITVKPNDISYMHGAKADPGMNINSYLMTDEDKHETVVDVLIDGVAVDKLWIPDDPADSRGVLSWHYQAADNKLEEAGSYGYLQKINIPSNLVTKIRKKGCFTLRLQVPDHLPDASGGLALYGRNAGRYPIDILVRYW